MCPARRVFTPLLLLGASALLQQQVSSAPVGLTGRQTPEVNGLSPEASSLIDAAQSQGYKEEHRNQARVFRRRSLQAEPASSSTNHPVISTSAGDTTPSAKTSSSGAVPHEAAMTNDTLGASATSSSTGEAVDQSTPTNDKFGANFHAQIDQNATQATSTLTTVDAHAALHPTETTNPTPDTDNHTTLHPTENTSPTPTAADAHAVLNPAEKTNPAPATVDTHATLHPAENTNPTPSVPGDAKVAPSEHLASQVVPEVASPGGANLTGPPALQTPELGYAQGDTNQVAAAPVPAAAIASPYGVANQTGPPAVQTPELAHAQAGVQAVPAPAPAPAVSSHGMANQTGPPALPTPDVAHAPGANQTDRSTVPAPQVVNGTAVGNQTIKQVASTPKEVDPNGAKNQTTICSPSIRSNQSRHIVEVCQLMQQNTTSKLEIVIDSDVEVGKPGSNNSISSAPVPANLTSLLTGDTPVDNAEKDRASENRTFNNQTSLLPALLAKAQHGMAAKGSSEKSTRFTIQIKTEQFKIELYFAEIASKLLIS